MNPMAPPTILVLASTLAEGTQGTSLPCQQPQHYGVSVTVEKPDQMPFLGTAYSLLYHSAEQHSYPPQLLPLPPVFNHASLEQSGVGLLSYGALPAFSPFPLPENMDCFPGNFVSVMEAKNHSGSEPPQGHCLLLDMDTEAQQDHLGQEQRGIRPLRASPSPHHIAFKSGDKKAEAASSLHCPVCQQELQCAELGDHLQSEIERLGHLLDRDVTSASEESQRSAEYPAATNLDVPESPKISPRRVSEDEQKVAERQQTFLQVKTNRDARIGARAGQFKRIRPGVEEQVEELDYRDGEVGITEGGEICKNHQFRENESQSLPQMSFMQMKDYRLLTARRSTAQESNLGMDLEGDEMPTLPTQMCLTMTLKHLSFKEDAGKLDHLGTEHSMKRTKGEKKPSGLSMEMLKAQIQDLRHQLLRRDTSKCHICLESYSVPLTSIQCWHIHCEQCWLRTLGAKKLCPQCNAITSPADLRRVYL